jgi:menaquinone-dependent protoporphyrinogen oxidase
MEAMTRRQFIAKGSILVGGAAGVMTMGDIIGPRRAGAADVVFPESSCGRENALRKKVLVAYASHCGTTGGVAEAIGRVLCERGAEVDVRLVRNVEDIAPYQALVIGSAVRSGSWWPDAMEFVVRNRKQLTRTPVAYFLTCLALYRDTEATRRVARGYMNPVLEAAPEIKPMDMGLFSGALDYSKLGFMYRTVMKSKMKKQGIPEGDFRDWDAIRSWAGGLCSRLLG